MVLFIVRMSTKIFLFIKPLLLRTILENIYVVLAMRKKSNLILFKAKKVMKLQMSQVLMEVVYKVQNMQQIEDNMIHEVDFEEDEAEIDLHSVVLEDLSVAVSIKVSIKVSTNHTTTMVHNKWLAVHHMVDHHVASAVQLYEVVDDHHSVAAMDMMVTLQVVDHVSFEAVAVQ